MVPMIGIGVNMMVSLAILCLLKSVSTHALSDLNQGCIIQGRGHVTSILAV
jgi:hypothetical protein